MKIEIIHVKDSKEGIGKVGVKKGKKKMIQLYYNLKTKYPVWLFTPIIPVLEREKYYNEF